MALARNPYGGDEAFWGSAQWVAGFDDVKLYHWHNYENWRLRRMVETYGASRALKRHIMDNLVDPHRVATAAFAFPTYGNGIKAIAPYMGFEWSQEDVSGTETIAMYFEYAREPEGNEELLERIIRYNQDDCEATRVVKDWLVEHA